MKNYQKISEFFSAKNKNIIIIVFLVIVLIVLGFLFYKNMRKAQNAPEEKEKQAIDAAARDAASVKLTQEERVSTMQELQKIKTNTLPSKQARARELEVINNLYKK